VRPARILLVILALGCVIAVLARYWLPERKPASPDSAGAAPIQDDSRAVKTPARPRGPRPVTPNWASDVLDGFRGDVHPLLHGSTRLEVTAHWTSVGQGRDRLDRVASPEVYAWFKNLQPARSRETYTERDFSAFLPKAVGEVGQLWALDLDKVARFLRQFHPRPSMQLVAAGRRAGPDGAFGLLRAKSDTYLDIAFRVHAEFYLTPAEGSPAELIDAWYTPAYLSGRVLVNKQTGTVDHFTLGLPTDRTLNVHLTMSPKRTGFHQQAHDIVRVERMELTGGDAGRAQTLSWSSAMTPAEADSRLARVFYKSLEIEWVPFDQALTQARNRKRPIFAVVSWGSLDDQSC